MRLRSTAILLGCGLVGGLLLVGLPPAGPATAAQTGSAEPPSLFVDTLDVDVVNVEVFVTDRDGRRIAGLGPEDFELLEDGEPVEITNFYAVEAGEAGRSATAAETPDGAARASGDAEATPAKPPEQQLHLAVYVDNANLLPGHRHMVLDRLEGFLATRLGEGDLVMLAQHGRTLEIVEPFTTDPSRIVQALSRIQRSSASGPLADAEERRVMRMIPGLLSGNGPQNDSGPDHAYQLVKNHVEQRKAEVRRQARALREMVQALSGLPGRKALLLVTGGMPQRPGEALYHYLENLTGQPVTIEVMREDLSLVFNSIAREANAHQVTLYTLDAHASGGNRSTSAAYSWEEAGGDRSVRAELDATRTLNLHEPLIHLADATGGQSIVGTANYDGALARAAVDFDSYYSLGYRSPGSGDGELHEIEVRVRRPGVKVRHRAGYVDKPRSERVADRTLTSLLLAVESNPLGVEIEIGEPERESKRRWLLPVMVRVPFRDIALIPNGDTEEGRLSLYLAVQDEHGVSDLHRHLYPVRVPADQLEEARGQTLGYYAMLEIRPGNPTLAVGVWDELSGIESFVRKSVEAVVEPKGRRARSR